MGCWFSTFLLFPLGLLVVNPRLFCAGAARCLCPSGFRCGSPSSTVPRFSSGSSLSTYLRFPLSLLVSIFRRPNRGCGLSTWLTFPCGAPRCRPSSFWLGNSSLSRFLRFNWGCWLLTVLRSWLGFSLSPLLVIRLRLLVVDLHLFRLGCWLLTSFSFFVGPPRCQPSFSFRWGASLSNSLRFSWGGWLSISIRFQLGARGCQSPHLFWCNSSLRTFRYFSWGCWLSAFLLFPLGLFFCRPASVFHWGSRLSTLLRFNWGSSLMPFR